MTKLSLLFGVIAIVAGNAFAVPAGAAFSVNACEEAKRAPANNLHGGIDKAPAHVEGFFAIEHVLSDGDFRSCFQVVTLDIEGWGQPAIAREIDGLSRFLKNSPSFSRGLYPFAHIDFANWRSEHVQMTGSRNPIKIVLNPPIHIERRSLPDVFENKIIENWLANNERRFVIVPYSGGSDPRAIGVDVALIGMFDTHPNKNEADDRSAGGGQGYGIERPSSTNLPFPKNPFLGALCFIFGALLSCIGLERARFALWLIGWPIGILGGVIFLLWAIPLVAEKIPSP
jgi:hypothetical protein